MIRLLRITAFLFLSIGSGFAAQPRIAVLDLFTDENSIRAQAAATNFTALLQAELTRDFQLVERAQIAAAEQELHLSAMNRGSAASGLRIGKWAKADFFLSGALTTEGENRQLELTLINTSNADAVAKTNLTLGLQSSAPLRDFGAQVLKVAPDVAEFLRGGLATNVVREKQITISVVYARPGNLAVGDDEARAFNEWPTIVEAKAAANPAIRVVRLPETRAAAAESTLMLAGLVEADPEAVTQVADYYVWTTGEALTVFHREPDRRGIERLSRFTVRIWDGRSEPKIILTTNAPNSKALPALADLVLENIKVKPTGTVAPGVREKVSSEWTAAAMEWRGQKSFSARELASRLEFNQLLRVFEHASFVNPRDPLPQEQSLFLRFNAVLDFEKSHQFAKSWAASEAWGAHLERFGPDTRRRDNGISQAVTVAAAALHWPAELLETIPDYVGSDLGYGAPLDASNEQKRAWRLFWLREMTSRAKATAARAADVAPILPAFEGFGYVGGEIDREELRAQLELLEALKPAIVELSLSNARAGAYFEKSYNELRKKIGLRPASLAVTPVGARRARLPRFDDFGFSFAQNPITNRSPAEVMAPPPHAMPLTNQVLAAPALIPPLDEQPGGYIDLPGEPGENEVVALAKSDGQLYVAVALAIEASVEGEARDLKQSLGAAARRSIEFFTVRGGHLVPAFREQKLDAAFITPTVDSFVFGSSNRLAQVVKGQLEFSAPLNFAPGLLAVSGDDLFTLTFPARDVEAALIHTDFKSGATNTLPMGKVRYATYGGSRAFAASATHLALSRGALEIFDRTKNSWTVTDLIPTNPLPPFGGRARPYPQTSFVHAGADGAFWIAGEFGLIYWQSAANASHIWRSEPKFADTRESSVFDQVLQIIETARQTATAKPATREHTRITAPVVNVAFEGKYAWLALADGAAILLDPQTEKVAQRVYTAPYVGTFEFADNALWIGSRGHLIKRGVRSGASIPDSEWKPIRLSPEEQTIALAALRDTERAAFLLMDGDRLKAREVLASKVAGSITNTQALHLLLTALSFDPRHGESKQRREFLEKVSPVPGPISDFAKAEIQRLAVEEVSDELFAKYDANKDHFLSDGERALLAKDPGIAAKADQALTIKMRGVFERADINRDGVLSFGEFMQIRYRNPADAEPFGMRPMMGPNGVDSDHDGKITVEELVAFARSSTGPRPFPPGRRFTNAFRPMISTNRP